MAVLTIPIYNREGAKVRELKLAPEVFGVAPKAAVLHEASLAQAANARKPLAHTKTRGEVRGGGKKPWAQKGTGRARHGSTRSPIWVGGGITFGPRSERNFSLKLNKKTKNLAIRMSLSDKVQDGKFVVVDEFSVGNYKTKAVAAVLNALPVKAAKTLLVLPVRDEKTSVSARNIPGVRTQNVQSMSLLEVLSAGIVLTTAAGVEKMTSMLKPKA